MLCYKIFAPTRRSGQKTRKCSGKQFSKITFQTFVKRLQNFRAFITFLGSIHVGKGITNVFAIIKDLQISDQNSFLSYLLLMTFLKKVQSLCVKWVSRQCSNCQGAMGIITVNCTGATIDCSPSLSISSSWLYRHHTFLCTLILLEQNKLQIQR